MIYRVTIDGEVYEGFYGTQPDAVYGAMLKQMRDHGKEDFSYSDWKAGRCTEEEWREAGKRSREWIDSPKLIGVERCPDKKGRHKARRVE